MDSEVELLEKAKMPFIFCHGWKVDHKLLLFSKGHHGLLSQDEAKRCKLILIENAIGGPKLVHSYEEALKVPVHPISPEKNQFVAMMVCGHLMHWGDRNYNIIRDVDDVYAFMDYCLYKLGHGHLKRKIPERIKEFIDKYLPQFEKKMLTD